MYLIGLIMFGPKYILKDCKDGNRQQAVIYNWTFYKIKLIYLGCTVILVRLHVINLFSMMLAGVRS